MYNEIGAGALEIVLLLANAFVCVLMVGYCYSRREQREFWSPPLYVAAVYIYYVILGPGIAVAFGGTIDRGVDMRPYYTHAWTGALMALISWIIGYWAKGIKRKSLTVSAVVAVPPPKLWRIGLGLNVAGICAFGFTTGLATFSMINPFVGADEPTSIAYTGAFANYFGLAVNFLIPGVALLFLLRLRGYGHWWTVLAWLTVAAGIYTSIGFRYRLVLLAGGLAFIYYIHYRRRPNLIFFGSLATVFVAAMGFIGENRSYGRGLQLKDSATSFAESLIGGFGEAGIFGTSGAVLAHVPQDRPLVWGEPIIQTLLMPVPSRIFPAKNSNGYLVDTVIVIYGERGYEGAAYMAFAEWYLAFWWPGVVVSHFIIGWGSRWIWDWYRQRSQHPLALVVYASAIPYLYVVFSRGYLPQVAMLFVYTVLPAISLHWWTQRRAKANWMDANRFRLSVRPVRLLRHSRHRGIGKS